MDLLELLERLCPPLGPPGREDDVRQVIRELVTPYADKVEEDRMGNLQAWLNPDARPLVMLDAHMDEVALVVQRVDDKGFLRVAPLGGLDPRLLPGTRVALQPRPGRRVDAVVAMTPPHVLEAGDKDKALGWDKLFLDTGLMSAEAVAQAGVEVGTPGVLLADAGPMGAGAYCARNLDDRAGCALLIAALMEISNNRPAWGLVCNFATSEEVGLRGAATASFHLDPDLALAVECTVGDTPRRGPGQAAQPPGPRAGRDRGRRPGGGALAPGGIPGAGRCRGGGSLPAQAAPLRRHRRGGHQPKPGRRAHRRHQRAGALHSQPVIHPAAFRPGAHTTAPCWSGSNAWRPWHDLRLSP